MALSLALSAHREVFVLRTIRSEMQHIVDKHYGSRGLRKGLYKYWVCPPGFFKQIHKISSNIAFRTNPLTVFQSVHSVDRLNNSAHLSLPSQPNLFRSSIQDVLFIKTSVFDEGMHRYQRLRLLSSSIPN